MNCTIRRVISFILALATCSGAQLVSPETKLLSNTVLTASAVDETDEPLLTIDKVYLKTGQKLSVSVAENLTLKYYWGDPLAYPEDPDSKILIEDTEDGLKLTSDYYEKWIIVEAYNDTDEDPVAKECVYFSKLPVVYINTDDGLTPAFKKDAKTGTLYLQNNDKTKKPLYDGKMTMEGRGNTTWKWDKKPYKIKLDKKTDFFGFGKSKKWVLLANYLDESLLRNNTAAGLSQELGLTTMQTNWVDVVINGKYAGNYQLCEQVGIEEGRVDINDWEDEAEDAADAIADALALSKDEKKALENAMSENFSWLETDEFTIGEGDDAVTVKVSDYYDYDRNLTGGYLFESSEEFDETSEFLTDRKLKIMMKSPEFLSTSSSMLDSAMNIWQEFEDAYCSEDGYNPETGKHYTELADLDSMVSYWLLMEILGNNDARYKSRYIFKNQDSKLVFGPPWDFDTGLGSSLVTLDKSTDDEDWATGWKVSDYEDLFKLPEDSEFIMEDRPADAYGQNFYREFLDDPLFTVTATEKYWQIRPYLESLICEGGILDQNSAYLYESGLADEQRWVRSEGEGNLEWRDYARGYLEDTSLFKEYLRRRIAWLDEQFAEEDSLQLNREDSPSAYPYQISMGIMSVSERMAADDADYAPAQFAEQIGKDVVFDQLILAPDIETVRIYVNGIFFKTVTASEASESFVIPASMLYGMNGKKNVISFIGKDAESETVATNFATVVQKRDIDEDVPTYETANLVLSGKIGVNFFLDLSALTNDEKAASYTVFTVKGKESTDLFDESHTDLNGNFGFTCYVTSIEMAEIITAVFHYGDDQTVTKTFSVKDYVTRFDEMQAETNQFDDAEVALVHSIADYGHYVQPWLAETNNWSVGSDYAPMNLFSSKSYDYSDIQTQSEDYQILYEKNEGIIGFSFNLSLNAETGLNIVVKPSEDAECTVSVFKGDVLTNYTANLQNDGTYLVKIPNITANKLNVAYTVKAVVDGNESFITVSPLSFANYVMNHQDGYNRVAKNAVSAFFSYYAAIAEYDKDH